MKITLFINILAFSAAFATFTYKGELLNFDSEVVSSCEFTSLSNLFDQKELTLTTFSFLDTQLKDVRFRFYMSNGVDGNLYIQKKAFRNSQEKILFNTDASFRPFEINILASDQAYRCVDLIEK